MSNQTLTGRFRQAPYTSAQLAAANPVLLDGEVMYERDTGKYKIGNGTTAWNSLPLHGEAGSSGGSVPTFHTEYHDLVSQLTLTAGKRYYVNRFATPSAITIQGPGPMEAAEYSHDAIIYYENPGAEIFFHAGEGVSRIVTNFSGDIDTFLGNFTFAVITIHFIPDSSSGGCVAIVNASGYYRK